MSLDIAATAEHLPLHTLQISQGIHLETGENGLHGLRSLCDAFVTETASLGRGWLSDTPTRRIVAAKKITRVLLNQPIPSSIVDVNLSGKEKAAIKQVNELSDVLKGFGIDVSQIDIEEAFVIKELAEAVESLNLMIETANPLNVDSEEHVLNTADALANWMDMFIKLHQRFELDDEQVHELFHHLFQQGKIQKLLAGSRLEHSFTSGLFGELSAYLHLYHDKQGQGTFTVPRKMLGSGTAIDLIWEHEAGPNYGIEYYEVKSDAHIAEPTMIDVLNDEEFLAYVDEIKSQYAHNEKEVRRRLRSVSRIRDFALEARDRNPSASFYSMRVPSLARKDTI